MDHSLIMKTSRAIPSSVIIKVWWEEHKNHSLSIKFTKLKNNLQLSSLSFYANFTDNKNYWIPCFNKLLPKLMQITAINRNKNKMISPLCHQLLPNSIHSKVNNTCKNGYRKTMSNKHLNNKIKINRWWG